MKEPTLISKMRSGRCGKRMAGMGVLLFTLILAASQAQAVIINTGSDLYVRFDNTITYSLIGRVSDQDPDLLADPNVDDGNRNFDKGIVMNRFDLLTEFDARKDRWGFRATGAGWYDFVYFTENDNDSPYTLNATSITDNKDFTDTTKRIHGADFELLDLFAQGAFDMGSTTVRFRAGQFSQWWGDSFFLGWNGVAGALAPVDVAKAATLPDVQLKELIRPIPQVSASFQVTDILSFDAYYQFAWEPARLFAQGSAFSPADLIGPGAERILTGPDSAFTKIGDVKPSDSGQFGVNMKLNTMAVGWGLYYNKFHSKDFYVVVYPIDGNYTFFYPEDIDSYGASANVAVGQYTFAAEVTYRSNVPLQSDIAVFPNFGPFVDMPHEIMYPTGDTLSVLLNTFSGGMSGNFFCDEQDLIAEVAYVTELSADNEALIADGYEKESLAATVHYTPKWHQPLPGWDLSLPLAVSYNFMEKPTTLLWGGGAKDTGSFFIGVKGTYNNLWDLQLLYNNQFGDGNDLGDRDYVSFFIRRAF